jgi:hypothetical protein
MHPVVQFELRVLSFMQPVLWATKVITCEYGLSPLS